MKNEEAKNISTKGSMKQMIINAPEGKVIDIDYFNESGNVRFIDEKPSIIEFPTKWELDHLENGGFYIYDDSSIGKAILPNNNYTNHNVLPYKHLAEQMLIFHTLITMRERYREIEILNNPELQKSIDWSDEYQWKYFCYILSNSTQTMKNTRTRAPFSFQLPETRDAFAANFGDMLLQCKDLLG